MVLGMAQDQAVDVGTVDENTKPKKEHNGQLIHLDGRPHCTSEEQYDTQLGPAAEKGTHSKNVTRKVQMYMWITQSHTEERGTGRYDSEGREETVTETIIDPPKLEWEEVHGQPSQPELPNGWSRVHDGVDYTNNHPCDFHSERFQRGLVMMGPYYLTQGMVNTEMRTVDKPIVPDVDAIKEWARTGGEHEEHVEDFTKHDDDFSKTEDDDLTKKEEEAAQDPPPPPADETTGLLTQPGSGTGSGSGSHSGFGTGMGSGRVPANTLSDMAKEYMEKTKLTITGDHELYMGERPGAPEHHDYKVSWTAHHIPCDGNGQPTVHTVLAMQRQKSRGGFGLRSWSPEGVEDFHIDSCCAYTCCIGYNIIERGLIDKCDEAAFPNASNDDNQEDLDIESLQTVSTSVPGRTAGSNCRTVEKLSEGKQTVENIIHELEELNNQKTKFYRYLGFFLMFLGFELCMSPFPTIFHFIPWVGHAIGFLMHLIVFVVALVLSCTGSITTISIAWVRYRPLWGIVGITISVALVVLVMVLQPPEHAAAAKTKLL
jgi:hypothetical protein